MMRLQVLRQKSVNHRPTMALLFYSLDVAKGAGNLVKLRKDCQPSRGSQSFS
jgi:hypothetical protein